jgi:hypothetical protein
LNVPTAPTKRGHTFRGWAFYTPIEYIESTGTQYIDTGYISTGNGYAYIETQFTPTQVGASKVVFGAEAGNSLQPVLVLNGELYYPNSLGNPTNIGTFVANTKYTVTISTNGNLTAVVNGTTYTGGTASVPLWSVPIYLFRHNHVNSTALYSKVKMHYFRLYDNGTLVRDMIPVLDENGVPCMLDKVGGQFYYNAGTGSFTAGPAL